VSAVLWGGGENWLVGLSKKQVNGINKWFDTPPEVHWRKEKSDRKKGKKKRAKEAILIKGFFPAVNVSNYRPILKEKKEKT